MAGLVYRSDGCPEPYERLDDARCILADPFKAKQYTEAIDYCNSHGGDLLTYDNCDDLLLIWDFIHSDATLAAKSYWLGATDQAEEGKWVFTHNQAAVPMGNPFWKHDQPSTSTSYNCASLSSAADHRWIDLSCTSSANTICLREG
ncbi:C-type lectin domain family 3 member A-like isoform X2 [Portunus trituberculatus]|uniref:C-type lectin domain family 3 member A-like isoform X2 n=1 Tax=Portunus trituberculatus TaxID=210409 RepID=UPI001E1CF6A2|nr:C-type lectin domain family 3 member A-like isoform X2 [Portunus trituberculatus]